MAEAIDHALEYLLGFDGRVHHYQGGYRIKFEIKRVPAGGERPHGLRYSFTLRAPDGNRILGFDNAHMVPARGSVYKKRPVTADHWHRTEDDPGRPYAYAGAEQLVNDFFDEVERILTERGIPLEVTRVDDRSGS